MKIGLIASAYNCAEFLEESLLPWKTFKDEATHKLVCSFVHNCFKENERLGLSIHSKDKTHEILNKYQQNSFLNYYSFSDKYLGEAEARNICLRNVLAEKVDYVWTIGLDEIYTVSEINKIISFIELNPFVDWFKINYKNYVFDGKQWIDGFNPPRIFKTSSHGGLKELYYDDDFVYNDGTDYKNTPSVEIPRSIAHVKHMTWLHSNGKAKVEYQKARWGGNGCSYSWDYEGNGLKFNEDFFKKNNQSKPALNKD